MIYFVTSHFFWNIFYHLINHFFSLRKCFCEICLHILFLIHEQLHLRTDIMIIWLPKVSLLSRNIRFLSYDVTGDINVFTRIIRLPIIFCLLKKVSQTHQKKRSCLDLSAHKCRFLYVFWKAKGIWSLSNLISRQIAVLINNICIRGRSYKSSLILSFA